MKIVFIMIYMSVENTKQENKIMGVHVFITDIIKIYEPSTHTCLCQWKIEIKIPFSLWFCLNRRYVCLLFLFILFEEHLDHWTSLHFHGWSIKFMIPSIHTRLCLSRALLPKYSVETISRLFHRLSENGLFHRILLISCQANC